MALLPLALRALARHSNAALLLATSCVCAGALYGLSHTAWGAERLRRAGQRFATHRPAQRVGIWRNDPRLGFTHAASSSGTHETPEFRVRYTIDADGCRAIPGGRHRERGVLFLGDSFTFGHGVEDHQTFSAVLSADHWPHVRVRNCGLMGSSTGQAYLQLERSMAERRLPRAVVYGWTSADLQRNHLRSSWLSTLHTHGRRNAYFDVEGGELSYRGTAGPEDAIPDDAPELAEREQAVTRALIGAMARLCARRSVRFLVVVLATREPQDEMGDWLVEQGATHAIEVLDLRSVRGPYFKKDGHPKAPWHRAVARALAERAAGRIGVEPRDPPPFDGRVRTPSGAL
jgi:hypothetical protein